MTWSDQSIKALEHWIGIDTWYTGDLRDENRFFEFVFVLWENDEIWDEVDSRKVILNKVQEMHPNFSIEHAEKEIHQRVSTRMIDLREFLGYLKKTSRIK
jgi:hypothetical protein